MVNISANKKKLDYEIVDRCYEVISHAPDNHGYPILWHNGKQYRAYQLVFYECFGYLDEGLIIRHKCDNRKCINPHHLESGTHYDNAQDRVKRGRSSTGYTGAKITKEIANEIRAEHSSGIKQRELSRKYNLSKGTISHIVNNRTWVH